MAEISNLFVFIIVFISSNYITSTKYVVNGEGMVEVFRWKQMDFFNRGDFTSSLQPTISEYPPGLQFNEGTFVFPNRGFTYGRRLRRQTAGVSPRYGFGNVFPPFGYSSGSTTYGNSGAESFIQYNNVPIGVSNDPQSGRLFITVPRRRPGIPSTLNYIDMRAAEGREESPRLYAYPDFDTNYLNPFDVNPNRIISVYRPSIDACRRLWFVDTGMLEYPNNRIQVQRPSIWIIDLQTNSKIHRFEIPEGIVREGRGLASITVDINPIDCGSSFAYLPDLVNGQIYVYSLPENRMWAFRHDYFSFDPVATHLNIGGQTMRLNDTVFSITLGPINYNQRNVYFHALASNKEFYVSNSVLKDSRNARRTFHGDDFKLLGYRGENKQSTMHEYDPRTGTMFYAEIQQNGVGCWNSRYVFSPQSHGSVIRDRRMIYPSDLTIDSEGTLWVISNSMPIFIQSTLDTNAFNFRIWKQSTYQAIQNTICA